MAHMLPLSVTAGVDGKLIIWDTATLSVRATCEHPEVRPVSQQTYSAVCCLYTWQPPSQDDERLLCERSCPCDLVLEGKQALLMRCLIQDCRLLLAWSCIQQNPSYLQPA